MSDVASWVALVATCLAAIITASNLGARITGYGFAIFFVGAIAWCVVGAATGQHQLLWSNVFLALVDLFGVWRWLYRRARADDAVKRSKSEAEAPGDRLFAAVDLVGKRLAGEGGRITLGRVEGLLADSDEGRLRFLVVRVGDPDGESADFRRVPWRPDLRVGEDAVVTDLSEAAFAALPRS